MGSEKIQMSIYKLNDSSLLEDIVGELDKKGYKRQETNENIQKFKIKLFYNVYPPDVKWKSFFKQITKNDQDILKSKKSWTESFVLLLLNEDKNISYSIVGGLGYFAIQEFIDNDFGMDILSRLIKKNDKVIRATREQSVVGGILGEAKFFRNNYTLYENESFGKIYQELDTYLDKRALVEKFGFSTEEIKKGVVCIAKSSFKINKSLTLDGLLQIIRECENIIETEKPIDINNVVKLMKNKDGDLIVKLKKELYRQLWNRYQGAEEAFIFDICHKEFEKYLTASKYIVRKNYSKRNYFGSYEFRNLYNIDDIFKQMKEHTNPPTNEENFIKTLTSLQIFSFNEEEDVNPRTHGKIIDHILGDALLEGKRYFFIDKAWYQIKDNFIRGLNDCCKSFIKSNYGRNPNGLTSKWPVGDSENQYNQKYIGKKNTIVLDKITPENIELCDILKWDDENVYLYHVKKGFGNTMRDLCSQIIIAARRLKENILSTEPKAYIEGVYDELSNKIGSTTAYFDEAGKQTQHFTKEQFLSLFDKKNPIFVLAELDTSVGSRKLENTEQFRSNIAKFSLQELVKEMRALEGEFRIIQLEKE